MEHLEFDELQNDLQRLEYNLRMGKTNCFRPECSGEETCNLIHYLIGKGKGEEYIKNFCKK